MAEKDLRIIATETMNITEEKSYKTDEGSFVELPDYDYSDVEVLSPIKLEDIEEDNDDFFESNEWVGGAKYYVINTDSFEAARGMGDVLVMNFANAHVPGGGFLFGAHAQEECLCRCSTLYKSISSDAASEMYEYNNNENNPLDSDYMLLSPDVCVFRDSDYNLLEEPYMVSVVTIPAPNRNGSAYGVKTDAINQCMHDRLKKMLLLAARCGYGKLILGAWGCGAFGNDTREVAQIFYQLFFEEGFDKYFNLVCFAILNSSEKEEIFNEVFKDHIYKHTSAAQIEEPEVLDAETEGEECVKVGRTEEAMYYISSTDAPTCNHTKGISDKNIGYVQGITKGGMPFEAEIYTYDSTEVISVIIPRLIQKESEDENITEISSPVAVGTSYRDECMDYSILDLGMKDYGEEENDGIVKKYVDLLVECGLVFFAGNHLNGHVEYRSDARDNNYAKVLVTLKDSQRDMAYTLLEFRPF